MRIMAKLTAAAVLLAGLAAGQDISDQGRQQIQNLLAQKSQFSSAQRKVSSSLMLAAKVARNELRTGGIADIVPPAQTDAQGRVAVEITGNVTPSLINQITSAGGAVTSQMPSGRILQANVPLIAVDVIASHPDVAAIRSPAPPHHNSAAAGLRRSSFATRNKLALFIGSVTSQGYISHGANQTTSANYLGTGVKVGVLSDSAKAGRVAALIASGDLPPNTIVLPGQGGDEIPFAEDEGTAMMEIIHDLAPGAQLYFATAFHSQTDFAKNIIALQQAGCKVIVDDVSYSEEGVFQDSVIAKAVNQVVAAGSVYFSSAANSGGLTHGTSGTWEGDFKSAGGIGGLLFHNFGTGSNPVIYDTLLSSSPFDDYVLQWSDPLHASANDYDFFLLNTNGSVRAFSIDVQDGTQNPIEEIYIPRRGSSAGQHLAVVLFGGSRRALHIDTERGELAIATTGATFGHNAGLNTVSMAATAWNSAHAGTVPFSGFANPTEVFSSDGPRKIFYQPNGTPITPGNFLFATNGGTTLQKPDLTAADGVFAKTPGFLPFFGTSAAAPHAAAIAALILGVRPDYSPAQVKQAMTATALDTMAPGTDRDAGFGITMALPAVQYALSH